MNKEQEFTLEQVIEQSFDFTDYSEQEKTDLIAETSGMIMESSLLRALDEGGEALQNLFNDFIETEPDDEKMTLFIQENIQNFGEIVVDEIKVFQELGKPDEEAEAETKPE